MLIGVFDLLADARAQIASVTGYVEALRDFWIAEADLRHGDDRPHGAAGRGARRDAAGRIRRRALSDKGQIMVSRRDFFRNAGLAGAASPRAP